MTATAPSLAPVSAEGRFSRLTQSVRALRTNTALGRLDLWMLVVGGLLMPLGIVFIIAGWLGASRTPLPFEQNDYLISGGVLGLGLVIAGGFLYFGYWQTVRIRESRDQTRELTAAIGRLESLLKLSDVAGGEGAAAGAFVEIGRASCRERV